MTRSAADLIATAVLPARRFTVTVRGENVTFESRFMDDIAWDLLSYVPGRFARSLYESERLSEKQLAWVHKLAVDFARDCEQDRGYGDAQTGDKFAGLFAAFEAAVAKGAKRLTLRFDGINVKPSRDLASLWVTSQTETETGRFGEQPKYLGKVTRGGIDSRLSDDVRQILESAAADPLSAAIRYGKVSGECSCCGRELTDPESIKRGIGPVCARKFGW